MLTQSEVVVDGPLSIEESLYGDEVLVVSLAGELDRAGLATARRHLGAALEGPRGLVVVDLGELEFLDLAAIALLYELARLRPGADSLRLLPSRHPAVNRVLSLTAVASAIPIVAA